MPIYTADPGRGINQPISNAPSGLGESLSAAFDEGLREGPLMSAIRMSEADYLAVDPDSEVITKALADARLRELGVKSVQIPESGVTKAYLDHLTQEKKDSLAKRQIAASAPGGLINTPLNFMASLAGSMADPANLAIGLIPFAGEAKAASLLGRAGERFVQGAAMGGAQTALTIPFTAGAAAAEGDDFTTADAMGNIFLSSLGGGLLHAGGGAIADLVRGRRASPSAPPVETASPVETTSVSEPVDIVSQNADAAMRPGPEAIQRPVVADDLAASQSAPIFERAIASDLDQYAYSRAYDDVIPSLKDTLTAEAQAPVVGARRLREESQTIQQQMSMLDATLPERTRTYQQQRMKFRDAQQRAAGDISRERSQLEARNEEISQLLKQHEGVETARSDLNRLAKGEIPERAKALIDQRASEISSSFTKNPVAAGVRTAARQIDEAHWTVRENAFRAGLSHMLQGKSPDVEPVFAMADPRTREASMRRIQDGPAQDAEQSTLNASADADAQLARATRDDADLQNAREDFDAEIELARNMTADIDSPELRKALDDITKEANDDSILKGLQAYATCMLRRL